jgi:hypothetical protein
MDSIKYSDTPAKASAKLRKLLQQKKFPQNILLLLSFVLSETG